MEKLTFKKLIGPPGKYLYSILVMLVASFFLQVNAQTVSGVVKDEQGLPLIGATVVEAGADQGTLTDIDGKFELTLKGNSNRIEVSYLGYQSQVLDANPNVMMEIILLEGVNLDEVVVTALGISREKKSLGYAVTDVKGEELTNARSNNAVNALNGKVAGLQIGQSASGAGGSNKVTLRGNASITGNNEVLYVVDGIPIDNSSNQSGSDSYGNNFDLGNGISDLNPDDIESVSVLKGPNAAALYGSRASNGVMLITTKKGKASDKIGISYSANIAFDQAAFLPEFQNSYGQGLNGEIPADLESLRASGSWGPAIGTNGLLWTGENGQSQSNPNNVQDFFDTGRSFTNSIGFDGGNEMATYRLSYTNLDYAGIVPGNEMDRNSVTLRGGADLSDKLSVDTKISYVNQQVQNRPRLSGWGDNVALNLYSMPRNVSLSSLENAYNESTSSVIRPTSAYGNNPYHTINETGSEDVKNRVYGFASLSYDFTDHLRGMVRAGKDYTNQSFEYFAPANHPFYGGGRYEKYLYTNQESNYDFLLSYSNLLTQDVNFDLNLGGNIRKNSNSRDGYLGTGLVTDKIYNVSNLNSPAIVDGAGIYEKQVNSLYASGQFGYQNFLYLDWSARNDWSSTLPRDNWSYFYPSVSLSAVLSEKMNVDFLQFLKLRVSYAEVGNDTGPYQLVESFTSSNTLNGGGLSSPTYLGNVIFRVPSTKANADLKPERTKSFEAGVELRALSNKLGMNFTVYNGKTQDQIISIPVPISSGYGLLFLNAGEVQNSGVEIAADYQVLDGNSFKWNVGLNYAKNTTTINSLYPEEGVHELILYNNLNGTNFVVKAVSKEAPGYNSEGGYAQIWGSDYVYDDQGRVVVNDAGLPIASESKYLGKVDPDWQGSLLSSMSYKKFGLNVLLTTSQGGNVVSMTQNAMDVAGTSLLSAEDQYRNGTFVVPNSATATGENTTEVYGQDYFAAKSAILSDYVLDASFIKCKEISLSYTMDSSISILDGATVSLYGRNLFFLQNSAGSFDPEAAAFNSGNGASGVEFYSLPGTRTFGANLSLRF